MLKMGIDIGSTTIKYVVIDDNLQILYRGYERHFSQISQSLVRVLSEVKEKISGEEITIALSGSAGMGVCEGADIPFVQEVFASRTAIKMLYPTCDVAIELGGEDAKILFMSGTSEIRMNGSCAGGTGAFVDQMATLLQVSPTEVNELAKNHEKIYSIASRCGVFAKSDIQPLLNQGVTKEDISASIFYAVVNQTVSGLAQGRKIRGEVLYLGGPLTFFSELRESFDKTLNIKGVFPENSLYFVALGTALSKEAKQADLGVVIEKISNKKATVSYACSPPLFASEEEFAEFSKRHKIEEGIKLSPLRGRAYIGIDAGSTTLKGVVVSEDEEICYYKYMENGGSPVPIVRDFLNEVYEKYPDIDIASVGVTGYGEEMIKEGFSCDYGVVETVAHFVAAKKYNKDVDFIIDIGGQDIKCFKIKDGTVDDIYLNEACSSGCGSFLQTFATALGEGVEEFSKKGLFAKAPVDLGSRCTVFMNSSVKQAQKDGAGIDNISAGLSQSVVKNALYKVIRITSGADLGKNIVVQGGTFLNNAVLRAFEQILGIEVTRPNIAGLMGAYGVALYAKSKAPKGTKSRVRTQKELETFAQKVSSAVCNLCPNACKLTINDFGDGRKFIAGNRCERPTNKGKAKVKYNLYKYKRDLLESYKDCNGKRGQVGIPLVLNMQELLPFWHTFFVSLGFGVTTTKQSTRETYIAGQETIPSDTVCYPAKLVHGHIETLLKKGCSNIFYPCLSYNFDEEKGDNNYNCPVVAYYPEVIKANVLAVSAVKYMYDYVGIHKRKYFPKKMHQILKKHFGNISYSEVELASNRAYEEYFTHIGRIRAEGKRYLAIAKQQDLSTIVLAGRPYHIDPEINHGIDDLIAKSGCVVVSEEAVCYDTAKQELDILNQWTYHARIFSAAKYVASCKDQRINLVQLVSFGCGLDSITTDEARRILKEGNKIYTQIKIDEITNLGAVGIRLRSLFAAEDGGINEVR